ncbi:hypothetical protein WR25_01563 [Diploscapter pachys]|uniref:Uncharacterized protein n=1 Tax=Diploscapter pachys TaxID=2018661 RepID=A0A2A2K5S3_9BILA|nr:hypothetical protein WR25_01563 [Diploscapter pachys]
MPNSEVLLTPDYESIMEHHKNHRYHLNHQSNMNSTKVTDEDCDPMPRRRRCDEKKEEKSKGMGFLNWIDQFADDTAMVGFRYLSSRYKNSFRLLWALVLSFFIGLTFYQVYERITYYFVKNPLTTRRAFDTPSQMNFPTIGICNKMQLKASSVANLDPVLLRAMALTHDEYGVVTSNRSFLSSLQAFDHLNILEIHKNAHQKIDDLFLSCEIGKRGSCLDDIRPIFTPNGLCFAVSPNVTIRRPGPETTLSLLLNLEVLEIIPGMVPDPGVILSIYDSEEAMFEQYTEGIHLEAGKVVTIPINEMRKLTRYENNCGRKSSGPFSSKEYSMAACQWANTMAHIEKKCKCRPIHSPYHRAYMVGETTNFTTSSNKTSKRSEKKLHVCTFRKEIECVDNIATTQVLDSLFDKFSPSYCPEDCEDVTFSSIVFGGRLVPTEIISLLPSDWDEMKEKKMIEFQKALDILPNDRIPVVRAVQNLANEAQDFVKIASKIFHIHPNHTDVPCFTKADVPTFEHYFNQFRSYEYIWERVTTYLQRSLSKEMNATASCLGLHMSDDGTINTTKTGFAPFNSSLLSMSLLQLSHLETALKYPDSVYGLKFMDHTTKIKIVDLVLPFVREMQGCITKMYDNPATINEIGEDCRKIFTSHYNTFLDAKIVYTFGNLDQKLYRDYEDNMLKIVKALSSAIYKNRVRMVDWHEFEINVRRFESLYREDGRDSIEILELLKLRKVMVSDILDLTNSLINQLKSGIDARERFYAKIDLPVSNSRPVEEMHSTIECLTNIARQIPTLKKSQFLRGEWMSKVQRQVELAQSYSASPQYDRVNLLHIKLYFAHFKRETIVQEPSYNMFLLLAEIGGTIGLYVGATMLTIAESIIFFFERKTKNVFVKPVKV